MKKQSDFRLYGIFGHPLSHTLSPPMQEAAFARSGLKAFYLPLELTPGEFKKTMRKRKRLVLDGFNVTVPYKETILPYLDHLSPEAKVIGAVNTGYRKGRKWIGTNTDAAGFLKSLKKGAGFRPRGKQVLIFGAGGSARAVIYGLASNGTKKIMIINRHVERAQKIVRRYRKFFPKVDFKALKSTAPSLKREIGSSDLIVNCTSLGLKPADRSLVPLSWIPRAGRRGRKIFFDLIYKPAETQFLKRAKKKGHRTVNGLDMLLFQGAHAFEIWTSKKAPVKVMRRALNHALKN